jgi:uncharacterized membrane protein
VAVVAILALGALLRILQFWPRRSLWLDELMIALNVTERSAGRLLLEPLDHFQVAPAGFLALSKLGVFLLGDIELGLRLFPLLFGLASLFLFWRVAVRLLSGAALHAALTLFAVSPALVWYAGNAKPYAGDVFATLLLILLALRFREGRIADVRRALLWGGIGALCVLVSQPAVLVASAAGAILVVQAWRARSRETRRAVLVLVGLAGVGAAMATAASLALVAPETRTYMLAAWSDQFLPAPWDGIRSLVWLPERLLIVLAHLVFFFPLSRLDQVLVGALGMLAIPGTAFLIRRRRPEAVLLAVPVVVAVLAAAVSLLPFGGRAAIYTGPSFLIASMAGISWLASKPWAGRRFAAVAALVVAGVPALYVLAAARPPYRAEEARPVLEAIRSRWRAGDQLYAYYGARYAMEFYGPRLGYRDWIAGNCNRGAPRAYLKELDALRGRPRVWVLFTHAYDPYPEPRAMRSYLEAIGTEIDRVEDPFETEGALAAEAYLYDLSDPVRLARTTAETHPLPPATGEHEGCVEFPRTEVVGTLLEPGAVEEMNGSLHARAK